MAGKPGWILVLLLSALLTIQAGWAQPAPEALRFVYIHGTNQNTPERHQNFNNRVARLHPKITSAFEKDPLIRARLLENGKLAISPRTINFFWGDLSTLAVESLRRNIYNKQLLRGWPHLSERARAKLNFTLHDAVWLEKVSQKKEVLNNLFQTVSREGSGPLVLMGHSAGSLVAYEFLLYRLPYVELVDFARELEVTPEVLSKLQDQGAENTCLEALLSSNAIRYDAQGKLVPFLQNVEFQISDDLRKELRNRVIASMPEYTRTYCLPQGRIRGLVTFGSPLTLFYASVANPQRDESYLTSKLFAYLLTNNVPWLHVNHVNDFIAITLPDKARLLEFIQNRTGAPAKLDGGFIANHVISRPSAQLWNAHSWYWIRSEAFSKAVTRAYAEGFRDWYPQGAAPGMPAGASLTPPEGKGR